MTSLASQCTFETKAESAQPAQHRKWRDRWDQIQPFLDFCDRGGDVAIFETKADTMGYYEAKGVFL